MASMFTSRTAAPKTKEQKKISSAALKINSAKRKSMLPGPVVVVYKATPAAV